MNMHLLQSSQRIIVALSGGKDSSTALQLTYDYCREQNKILHGAVIINHNFRCTSSSEAQQVKAYWKTKNVNVTIINWNNPIFNQKSAREFRLMQLAMYATKHQVDTVILGHTLMDKIETYLMRTSNSTHWGLASIAPVTYIYGIKFVRPLLYTSNDFIYDYLRLREIEIIEDDSNRGNKYTRNVIRHSTMQSINIRETLHIINGYVMERRTYQMQINSWIKMHLIIINRFHYKFIWHRLPSNRVLSCLILKQIAESIKGRRVSSWQVFLPFIDEKQNFHVQDCKFFNRGCYTHVTETIPFTTLLQEGIWHHKFLVVDLKNKHRTFNFNQIKIPYFSFNNEIVDLSCQNILTQDDFYIKYIAHNFYSVY